MQDSKIQEHLLSNLGPPIQELVRNNPGITRNYPTIQELSNYPATILYRNWRTGGYAADQGVCKIAWPNETAGLITWSAITMSLIWPEWPPRWLGIKANEIAGDLGAISLAGNSRSYISD